MLIFFYGLAVIIMDCQDFLYALGVRAVVAKKVIQGFQELRQRLEITDLQASAVSIRQQGVREVLEKELPVLDGEDFLTGSYIRNTMIAPLKDADIDIFVVLDGSFRNKYDQASLLDKVKYILKNAYRNTIDISRDGQAVTISFNEFKVDVVPAFPRRGVFGKSGYWIADTISKQWIPTDPKKHIEIWSKANKYHKGNLVPLIKMIKCWNRENDSLLHSFHLDCLILQILNPDSNFWYIEPISDFPSAIRYVFDKARSAVKHPVSDPAGYNANLGTYLKRQNKEDEVLRRLELAYRRAKNAEEWIKWGNNAEEWIKWGNIEDAYYYWRKIFGDYFPAYG